MTLLRRLDLLTRLTPRQREIAALVVEGYTNAEIAQRLGVTEQSIKERLRRSYRAVGISLYAGNPRIVLTRLVLGLDVDPLFVDGGAE